MEILIVLTILVVVLMVTLVGHGIWVVVSWMARGGRRKAVGKLYEPTLSDDRSVAGRSLHRLRVRGLIDEQTYSQLMKALADDLASGDSVRPIDRLAPVRDEQVARRADETALPGRAEGSVEPSPPRPPVVTPPVSAGAIARPQPPQTASRAQPKAPAAASEYPPSPPAEPRRPFTEMLASFMAEKNIRWGELVGGLLILCCSTALVISLWSQIESIPILKFVIFTTITAALFGAGLFVHHRWKLPTTGPAVLIISALLVPLNLLAFAAFSQARSGAAVWTTAIEAGTLVLFGWLAWMAGRVVLPAAPKLFAGGVVGISASSLLMKFMPLESSAGLLAGAAVPIGLYALVMAGTLWRPMRAGSTDGEGFKQSLLQLGVQSFACVVPLGLLVHRSGSFDSTMQLFGPVICAAAVPGLFIGLFGCARLAGDRLAQLRTAAVTIAMVAAALMLIGVGLAWPVPSRLLPAVVINGVAMIGLTRVTGHRAVHALAVAWFAAACVLVDHLVMGSVNWSAGEPGVLIAALLSARTGKALVAVVAACVVIGLWLGRKQRADSAGVYYLSAAALAAVSVVLVTVHGFGVAGDAQHVFWVYAVYASSAFAASWWVRRALVTWCGIVLLQMAIAQLLVYTWPIEHAAWATALLCGASIFVAAAVATGRSRMKQQLAAVYIRPWTQYAAVAPLAAIVLLEDSLTSGVLTVTAVRFAWVSVVWFAVALITRWPVALAGGQLALVAAGGAVVQHVIAGQPWYQALSSPLGEPWVWQAHLLVVSGFCLMWAVVRNVLEHFTGGGGGGGTVTTTTTRPGVIGGWAALWRQLLDTKWPTADRWLTWLVVAAISGLSIWSVAPGVAGEHGQVAANTFSGRHVHASGAGSWALLAVVAVTLLLHLHRPWRRATVFSLLVVGVSATALLAANFEPAGRVVSVWRWLLGAVVMATGVGVWAERFWLGSAKRLAARLRHTASVDTAATDIDATRLAARPLAGFNITDVTAVVLGLYALPAVLLTATYLRAVGHNAAVLPAAATDIGLRVSIIGPAVLIAIALIGFGMSRPLRMYAAAFASVCAVLVSAVVLLTEVSMMTRASGVITAGAVVWHVQLHAMVSAVVALAWRGGAMLHASAEKPPVYPSWPLTVGRVVLAVVVFIGAAVVWLSPQSVPAAVGEVGSAWGFVAVALIELSLLGTQSLKRWVDLPISMWAAFVVGLFGCWLAPYDGGNWVCFHALAVGLVLAGWLHLYIGHLRTGQLLGGGYAESFATSATQSAGGGDSIDHDLSCATCGYNLRGLLPTSRCPECGADIAASMQHAIGRLAPASAADLARLRTMTVRGVLAFLLLTAAFALRAAFDDPHRPWWSVALLAVSAALCMTLGGWAPRRMLAYLGGAAAALAASIWFASQSWHEHMSVTEYVYNFTAVNVMAVVAAGGAWLWIERRYLQQRSPLATARAAPFHRFAAIAATAVVTLLAWAALVARADHQALEGVTLAGWLAWALTVLLVAACWKGEAFRHAGGCLYVLGLAAVALMVSHNEMALRTLALVLALCLAAYALLTCLVWRFWPKPARTDGGAAAANRPPVSQWLNYSNGGLTLGAVLLAGYVSLTDSALAMRMVASAVPLLCAGAAALAASNQWARGRTFCVGLLGVGGVLFSWAWVSPDAAAGDLHRAVGLVAALAVYFVACGLAVGRMHGDSSWRAAVRQCVIGGGVLSFVALAYCSLIEIGALIGGEVPPLAGLAVIALIASLSLMIAACIWFAVWDRFDPLRVVAPAKGGYIYLGEGLGVVLSLHIRATMPWVFHGLITSYWPLWLTGLAVAGVAIGHHWRRRGLAVLGRPLERTGVVLPAVVGFEVFLQVSKVHFSLALLTAGGFYAVLAAMRRSFAISMLATLALNASLWYLLYHTPGLGLTQHPQLWFIPLALAVLVAGQLNRGELSKAQRTTLHYVCLLAIYLSSTADIFLTGVAVAPWLPLVLGGLSVAGIFVGLGMRIRSFFFLGTGFLCLSLLTMIWHAAADLGWTWVWYVAGIALGVAIITVFALFEKKRTEMNAWISQVKDWAG